MPRYSSSGQDDVKLWKCKCESLETDILYWKSKCEEIEQEYDEFRQSSQMLEKELEASLEQTERTNRELRTQNNRLRLENETFRDKYEQEHQDLIGQINELQDEGERCHSREEHYVKYIRELEQKNDDLERSQRAMYMSLADFESKLNSAIEHNALLESELVDKEELKGMVQRLKDEARDLKQEIQVREREMQPDNDKALTPSRRCSSFRISSAKNSIAGFDATKRLSNGNTETPIKAHVKSLTQIKPGLYCLSCACRLSSGHTVLTTPTRVSAMNIVGDLLRKVGALETKLANCRMTPEQSRDRMRVRNKLNRGTSTPSIHSLIRS